MIARLEMPFVDRMVQRGVLLRWLKAEGNPVAYGDDVCEVAVGEVTVLKKSKDARTLASAARTRRSALHEGHRTRKRAGQILRVTSSDTGVLRRIVVREQEQLAIGDLLAVLTTEPDETLEGEAFSFRVVTSRVEPGAGQWL